MLVVPNSQLLQILEDYATLPTDPAFETPTMHLFQNDFAPNVAMVLADLTEATFSGYAAAAGLAWGAPFINADGRAETDLPSQQFQHDGGAVANLVYGYYLTNAAGTVLYGAERFADAPIAMSFATNAIVVLSRLTQGNQ